VDRNDRSATNRRRGRSDAPRAGRPITKPRTNRVSKGLVRALVRAGSKSDHLPAVAHKSPAPKDRTVCGGCGAVFTHKTWRRSARRLEAAAMQGAVFGTCPACRQAANGRAFGRVVLEGSYVAGHADELERRIRNVAARAGFTQPERRVVDVVAQGSTLEVLTTSQKLAHRIARELAKAFQGTVSYHWSAPDGRLSAVWRRDEEGTKS
jgi:hypothetical protein